MAIFSNAFWVWLIPNIGTAGASGIVFALQGSVLGFALLNSLCLRNIRKEQNRKRRIQLAGFYSFNLVVFVAFFLQIVLAPTIFLNVATAVNVVIHGIAFLGASPAHYLVATRENGIYRYLDRITKSKVSVSKESRGTKR